jgi:hypothetical protein
MRAFSIFAPLPFLLFLLVSPPSRAQKDNPVLVYCDDGDIQAGDGSCALLVKAIQGELTDFYLDVVHIGELVGPAEGRSHVPAGVAKRTGEAGAIFAVWLTRSSFAPGKVITLNVYDPGIEQTISRTLPAFDPMGNLNHADVAFHTRIIMGASLYSDIDSIQNDENLVALAIPEERVEFLASREPVRRTWVRFDLGYLFSGYPQRNYWYHGILFDAAFVPFPRFEVFLDLGLSFMQEEVTVTSPAWVSLDNRQVHVGIGARYDVLGLDRIGLLPSAGFHVGVSSSDVTVADLDRDLSYHRVHPAGWAGLDVRVHIVRHVSLALGMRFENLFRRERIRLVEDEENKPTIFEISQFRFAAFLLVCVSI